MLQDHAGNEASALLGLGRALVQALRKEGALQPLVLAQAELAVLWL